MMPELERILAESHVAKVIHHKYGTVYICDDYCRHMTKEEGQARYDAIVQKMRAPLQEAALRDLEENGGKGLGDWYELAPGSELAKQYAHYMTNK